MNSFGKMTADKVLKHFGGFVRYFDTTEDLSLLAALVSAGDRRNILACCGGGDQALTMLGAAGGSGSLWAIDLNPAQLFVLAAKTSFLKKNGSMPSFEQIRKAYPGKIAALKKNIRNLHQLRLCHTSTGKTIAPPAGIAEKYTLIVDDEMFVSPRSGPYWKKDRIFMARVIKGAGGLRFAHMDIFDSASHFKQGTFDLIYLSDIYWSQNLPYYQEKLARMAGLLRVGGRFITHLDQGDDFMGRGISPGRMLEERSGKLNLKIRADQSKGGYLVLERMRGKR